VTRAVIAIRDLVQEKKLESADFLVVNFVDHTGLLLYVLYCINGIMREDEMST
jgi:hypothetical protein